MGARILIQSGIGSGTIHWIQRNVVRIGSDPAMDLVLPSKSLATHAMTLEYREGGYWVHNRSDSPLHLGGRSVLPKASDRWFDTDLLELPGETRLAIEFDEDPSPEPKPLGSPSPSQGVIQAAVESGPLPAPALETSSTHHRIPAAAPTPLPMDAKKSSSSMWLQIGVIVVCIGACGLLLVRDRQKKQRTVDSALPSFDQLVDRARKQEPRDENLLQHLQFAELAMIRGHQLAARQRYGKVRAKLLVRQRAPAEVSAPSHQDLHHEIFRWVEYRLSQ